MIIVCHVVFIDLCMTCTNNAISWLVSVNEEAYLLCEIFIVLMYFKYTLRFKFTFVMFIHLYMWSLCQFCSNPAYRDTTVFIIG